MVSFEKQWKAREKRFQRLHRPAREYRLWQRCVIYLTLCGEAGRSPRIHAQALAHRIGDDRPRLP